MPRRLPSTVRQQSPGSSRARQSSGSGALIANVLRSSPVSQTCIISLPWPSRAPGAQEPSPRGLTPLAEPTVRMRCECQRVIDRRATGRARCASSCTSPRQGRGGARGRSRRSAPWAVQGRVAVRCGAAARVPRAGSVPDPLWSRQVLASARPRRWPAAVFLRLRSRPEAPRARARQGVRRGARREARTQLHSLGQPARPDRGATCDCDALHRDIPDGGSPLAAD
jgi:hypothetical protein